MRFVPLTLVLYALVAFGGCEDNGSSPADNSSNEGNNELAEEDTPKTPCEASEEGVLQWLDTNVVYQVCENGFWVSDSVKPHTPGFNLCQFNFGAAWQQTHKNTDYYAGLDYVSVWLGDNDFYNGFEQRLLAMCFRTNATPMIYAYVIAEFGKDHEMDDCDVAKGRGKKSLCVHGANLIREFFSDSILYRYQKYASGMANQIRYENPDAKNYETIWMIEPDYYQYSQTASNQSVAIKGEEQLNGGVPDSMMGVYFKQIVDTIKTYLPAAKIAIDISPWITDWDSLGLEKWFAHFDMSIVDYVSTSGGRTLANSEKIRGPNKLTWKKLYETLKKPILADAGYSTGGMATKHDTNWDDISNLEARAKDGVVGVMQMDAALDYPLRASYIRSRLQVDYPWCKE